jgi:hypothetical protein
MKIEWHKVTWYSWTLAGIVFLIVVPLLAFYFVGQYEEIIAIKDQTAISATSSQVNILKQPVTQNKIVSSIVFNDKIINQGEVFTISPSDDCAGAIKMKLVKVLPDSIIVNILADKWTNNGDFVSRKKIETIVIKNGSNVSAEPLCTDIWSNYLFGITKKDSDLVLSYKIQSGSSMPLPVD